eukprot:3521798-Rhodomonas_salina.1
MTSTTSPVGSRPMQARRFVAPHVFFLADTAVANGQGVCTAPAPTTSETERGRRIGTLSKVIASGVGCVCTLVCTQGDAWAWLEGESVGEDEKKRRQESWR